MSYLPAAKDCYVEGRQVCNVTVRPLEGVISYVTLYGWDSHDKISVSMRKDPLEAHHLAASPCVQTQWEDSHLQTGKRRPLLVIKSARPLMRCVIQALQTGVLFPQCTLENRDTLRWHMPCPSSGEHCEGRRKVPKEPGMALFFSR